MKIFFCALILACLVVGCAPHYNITLTSGNVITTRGKPKYDPGTSTYRFNDSTGRPESLPAFRVKEIAPQ